MMPVDTDEVRRYIAMARDANITRATLNAAGIPDPGAHAVEWLLTESTPSMVREIDAARAPISPEQSEEELIIHLVVALAPISPASQEDRARWAAAVAPLLVDVAARHLRRQGWAPATETREAVAEDIDREAERLRKTAAAAPELHKIAVYEDAALIVRTGVSAQFRQTMKEILTDHAEVLRRLSRSGD